MGNLEPSSSAVAARSGCGHWSGGPSGEADQRWVRISEPMAPPPLRKEVLVLNPAARKTVRSPC